MDEAAREIEMHRPDGVPDAVQHVDHGAQLVAQFHKIGHAIPALTSQTCARTCLNAQPCDQAFKRRSSNPSVFEGTQSAAPPL